MTTVAALGAATFFFGGLIWSNHSTTSHRNLVRVASAPPIVGTARLRHQTATVATLPVAHAAVPRPAPAVNPSVVQPVVRPVAPPPVPITSRPVAPPVSGCAAAIAAVEAKGLYPAAGYIVSCPGNAQGREGMTCYNIASICPGQKTIAIADPTPYVVANEFENSLIISGTPGICDVIDCGSTAYGF